MSSLVNSVLQMQKLGVVHSDLSHPENIILARESQIPVIIDFTHSLTLPERPRNPQCIQEEREDLFMTLKGAMRDMVALQCFEQLFSQKKDDPEWKSFMLGMDERKLKQWKPWNKSQWESAKRSDEELDKDWEERFGKKVPPNLNWKV